MNDPVSFCESVCNRASEAGHGLRLIKTPEGHAWEWGNGAIGETTAHTPPVALLHACQDYVELEKLNAAFAAAQQ